MFTVAKGKRRRHLSAMNLCMRLAMVMMALTVVTSTHAADKPASALPKLHPKVFAMVDCWISDSEAPVVTEFNLDALEANTNQFFADDVKEEDGWMRSPGDDGMGFLRYRVVEAKDNRYKIEFQSNGGGTLTTAAIIECSIAKREMKVNGETKSVRVLRVLSFASKSGE